MWFLFSLGFEFKISGLLTTLGHTPLDAIPSSFRCLNFLVGLKENYQCGLFV